MSIYAIVWAYEQDIANSGAKFALVTAAQYCNDEGICWVKQETLAQDMSMGTSTVRKHLAHLEDDLDIIERIERRRKDGTRSSDFIKLVGFRKRSNRAPDAPTTAQYEQINRSNRAGKKRQVETSRNDLSLDKSATKPPKPKNGITKLMDRVAEARNAGEDVTALPSRDRKSIGAFYRQYELDGASPEHLAWALDYMVAKASGKVDGEPKAWCGFGTAMDRVKLDGWRPKGATVVSTERLEEIRRMREESARLLTEAGVS